MAIILSKKRESRAGAALRKISRVALGQYGLSLAVLAIGSSAFGLGVLSGKLAEPVPALIQARAVEAVEAGGEAARLSKTSRMLLAAVMAYRREHGALPESLEALHPVYLEALPDSAWTLEGQSVRRLIEDESVCGALGVEDTDASPAIDEGAAGLRCFRTLEGTMFAHRLIDEPVKAFEMAHLLVSGELEDRLLTWTVRTVPSEDGVGCRAPEDVDAPMQSARLMRMEGRYEARYCVPVFAGEHEPIHRVMSLTKGEGSLIIGGLSLGRAWSLQVATALCEEASAQVAMRLRFGEQTMMPVQCAL